MVTLTNHELCHTLGFKLYSVSFKVMVHGGEIKCSMRTCICHVSNHTITPL